MAVGKRVSAPPPRDSGHGRSALPAGAGIRRARPDYSLPATRLRLALGALLLAGVAGISPALSQNYDVTTLPFVDFNVALNDNGVIAGEILNPDGSVSLAEWSHGTLANLGVPSGLSGTITYVDSAGINDSGTIVGNVGTSTGFAAPFIYSNGTFTLLPPVSPLAGPGYANSINNLGQIVGGANGPKGEQGWLWSNGTYTSLPVVDDNTSALRINSSGTIVGNHYPNCCTQAAGYILSGSTVQYLSGGVNAINDAGVATGSNGMATVIHNGTETPILNLPSSGAAINSAGEIVGYYIPAATGVAQAFLWNPKSGAFDVTPNGYGVTADGYGNAEGVAVNDQGDILGVGVTATGHVQDFLLTPDANGALIPIPLDTVPPAPSGVPEPDTLLLFGFGLAAIVAGHRARLTRSSSGTLAPHRSATRRERGFF
jgi:PEP-CTERM motif